MSSSLPEPYDSPVGLPVEQGASKDGSLQRTARWDPIWTGHGRQPAITSGLGNARRLGSGHLVHWRRRQTTIRTAASRSGVQPRRCGAPSTIRRGRAPPSGISLRMAAADDAARAEAWLYEGRSPEERIGAGR
jgi:hypothetical protein